MARPPTVRASRGDEPVGRTTRKGRVRERFNGERWGPMSELSAGNAGIGLGALVVGDVDLAVTVMTPYLAVADRTAEGVNWAARRSPARYTP